MNGWYDLKGFNSGLLDKTLSGNEITEELKSVRLVWKSGAMLKFISCNWPPEIFKGNWEVNFFSIFRVTVNAAKKEWNPKFQPVQAVPNLTISINPIHSFEAKDWEWFYFGAIFPRLWRKFWSCWRTPCEIRHLGRETEMSQRQSRRRKAPCEYSLKNEILATLMF